MNDISLITAKAFNIYAAFFIKVNKSKEISFIVQLVTKKFNISFNSIIFIINKRCFALPYKSGNGIGEFIRT